MQVSGFDNVENIMEALEVLTLSPLYTGTCSYACNIGFHKCADDKCYADGDASHCGSSCSNCKETAPTNSQESCSAGKWL